jgi:hypothetical protein
MKKATATSHGRSCLLATDGWWAETLLLMGPVPELKAGPSYRLGDDAPPERRR